MLALAAVAMISVHQHRRVTTRFDKNDVPSQPSRPGTRSAGLLDGSPDDDRDRADVASGW